MKAFAIFIVLSGIVCAKTLDTDIQVDPHEINDEVNKLRNDEENTISKDAIDHKTIVEVEHQDLLEEHQPPVVAKTNLANEATSASTTAVAALTGLKDLLDSLELEESQAHDRLAEEETHLKLAEKSATDAQNAADESLHQISVLTAALNNALIVFQSAQESAKLATSNLDAHKTNTEKAKARFQSADFQLKEALVDFQATKTATELAEKSASEAHLFAFGTHMNLH